MTSETAAGLLRRAVRRDPARPCRTHYDDAGRVELSYATFDNWVAKTANLLIDELDVRPGDRVALALPVHWQTAVWLLACWSTGAVAVPVDAGTDLAESAVGTAVVAADADRLGAARAVPDAEVVGLSLHPLGGGLPDGPSGVLDYAIEVRAHADRFEPPAPIGPDAPAVVLPADGATTLTTGELAALARGAADDWDLTAADRVYFDTDFVKRSGLLAGLLAPMVAGASVVTCTNSDIDALIHLFDTERITATTNGALADSPATRQVRCIPS